MKLNDFTLEIPPGQEQANGYVGLQHGQHYRIRMTNSWRRQAEAAVYVDGKHIGTFRLGPRQSMELERPQNDTGKFTFYLLGTADADKAGLSVNNPKSGLVQVVFTPEVQEVKQHAIGVAETTTGDNKYIRTFVSGADEVTYLSGAQARMSNGGEGQSMSAGGTGLSGSSNQRFTTVAPLVLDLSQRTTISLRLVGLDTSGPRPLQGIENGFANAVPPIP